MIFSLDIYSAVALGVAIITLFVGIAAITNARRLNQQKHHQRSVSRYGR